MTIRAKTKDKIVKTPITKSKKKDPLADRGLAYSLLSKLTPEDFKLIQAEIKRRAVDKSSLVLTPTSKFYPLLHKASDFKVYYGGRDSAKSWTAAEAAIRLARSRKTRFFCTREFQVSIRDSIHRLLKDTIERMGLGHEFKITDREITHKKTKSEFLFKGLHHNTDEIKSTEGIDICIVEEAHFTTDESWELLIPTIRKEGAEIWILFNTTDENTATHKRFITNPPAGAIVCKVGFEDNPFLSERSKRAIEHLKTTDYESYLHVYGGLPKKVSDAAVLKRVKVQGFDDNLWEKAERLHFGADFGFAADPNTLIRSFIIDRTLYIEYEAFGHGVELDEMPQLYDSVPGSRRWPIKGDSSRPETISHLKSKGFKITAAEKWQGSVEDGIAHLNAFTQIIIHPRCKNIAQEASLYKFKVDRNTGDILPIIVDDWNHGWDAVRYSLDGYIQRKGNVQVWTKLGKR
jgi:phage terminase large subunit